MVSPLFTLLDGYSDAALLRIAEFNRIVADGPEGDRTSLITALMNGLSSDKRSARAYSRLCAQERAILSLMLQHGGEVDTDVLREQVEQKGLVTSGSEAEPHYGHRAGPGKPLQVYSFRDAISHLMLHGLVFNSEMARGTDERELTLSPGSRLVVPEPIRQQLPKPTLPSVVWGNGKLPAPVSETATDAAQRELFIYWSFVRAHPVPLTQAGLVQKRVLRSINQQLLIPDLTLTGGSDERMSPRLHFMRLLLQELGLLVAKRSQMSATGQPKRVPQFWEQAPEVRTLACLRAWVNMRKWSELASLSLSSLELHLPEARGTLLEQLRLVPPLQWISSERFLNRLKTVSPRLLFRTGHSSTTDGSGRNGDDTARRVDRLREIEAAFVGGSLSGPLHWLGIVDVSSDEDRVLAFRINSGGARALAYEAAHEEPPENPGRLVVQPDFRIFALGRVPERILVGLETFADRVRADRSVFEYLLSRESIHRAQQENWAVADTIAFLEEHASVAIPRNVLRTLQDWAKQQERIRLHRSVSLLETASPHLLKKLWDDGALRIHLERRLTPTVATIRKRRVGALQEALLEQGVLPNHSTAKDFCSSRVKVTEDGNLRPICKGPDMLLETCLRRLAEERDGRFYVTEAAVTHALSDGMTVPDYIHELAKLNHGPLPPALILRIKAWGQYYGEAHLREAVLLEVKDATVATELLGMPRLNGMLSRFPGDPDGKVLLVHTDDLEALRSALRQHGIDLV